MDVAQSLDRSAGPQAAKDLEIPGGSPGMVFDFWPLPRPMTKGWGNGRQLMERMAKRFGQVDVVFGATDGIPDGPQIIDHNTGYEWRHLSFSDNLWAFGYWDPPYDHLYKTEAREIWRTCRKLAILHTHVYPTSWLEGAKRVGMVAVTMGPLKTIRCLQVFDKVQGSLMIDRVLDTS